MSVVQVVAQVRTNVGDMSDNQLLQLIAETYFGENIPRRGLGETR